MRLKPTSFKVLRNITLLLLASLPALNVEILVITSAQSSVLGSFSYKFIVNEDGFTLVNINYQSDRESGTSWVFVPRFSDWTNHTTKGKVTKLSLSDTENYVNEGYYFYKVLNFSFVSEESGFEMNIQFNFSTAAMIIEPNGIFYSPQIGFEKGNNLETEVIFPYGFKINGDEALASGNMGRYPPSHTNSNYVLFDNVSVPRTENLIRIEIGFKTFNETLELSAIKRGIFTFKTVRRYESYAHEILNLYNKTYGDFVRLFNVTLKSAELQFFLPDFNSLLSIGGYVPFSGRKMGEININIVFTRYVKGYVEVIALHELVHHFLWKAGISPQTFLWFHEGMAQYVSIETANRLGYEGSDMTKQDLEGEVLQLERMVGKDLGFLKEWTPSYQPRDMGTFYVAAYYVVSRLAENRGGLEYYASFFKLISGKKVNDNAMLGYYLSLAANESVIVTLNEWKFGILDLYAYSTLIYNVESVLISVNPIFQPYKFLAELLYRQALSNAGKDNSITMRYLAAAMLIARLAPLLTLITVSGVLFGAILLVLKKEGVFEV